VNYIWSCACGQQTPCSKEDQAAGAVWHCRGCGVTFGCVRRQSGPKVWVTIAPDDVEFHSILETEQPQ
jgi:hypothetical protein